MAKTVKAFLFLKCGLRADYLKAVECPSSGVTGDGAFAGITWRCVLLVMVHLLVLLGVAPRSIILDEKIRGRIERFRRFQCKQ